MGFRASATVGSSKSFVVPFWGWSRSLFFVVVERGLVAGRCGVGQESPVLVVGCYVNSRVWEPWGICMIGDLGCCNDSMCRGGWGRAWVHLFFSFCIRLCCGLGVGSGRSRSRWLSLGSVVWRCCFRYLCIGCSGVVYLLGRLGVRVCLVLGLRVLPGFVRSLRLVVGSALLFLLFH